MYQVPRTFTLPDRLDSAIRFAQSAGLRVRALKMSLKEFCNVAADPRSVPIKHGRYRGVVIRLVKGNRWTS